MNSLNLAENIITLRRKKGITQEQLADFLGVTKASVSKWETRQSYPDILLLPQIAAYFGISIDDLLGYEPQMSSEQIKDCYLKLANEFARLPFEEVMNKSRELVKEYYSCYPLLIQIANLWLNHYMLASDAAKQTAILKEILALCGHIHESCHEVGISSNAVELKAAVNLILGNAKETIEDLEPIFETKQFILQSDPILIQAYQMTGNSSKANLCSQITIYSYLLALVSNSIGLMGLQMTDSAACETTLSRIRQLIETYDLENLHPNITLQFHYQAAVFYCVEKKPEQALAELDQFVSGSLHFIESGLKLHGDPYFNRIEEWFDQFALKTDAPRNETVVMNSLIPALEYPALSLLFDTKEYRELKRKIERKLKKE